jgi:predicted transcriptional regulator
VVTSGAGDDSATRRLDSLAETVSGAVTSYAERAALFDRRRVSCAELQRGLLTVEEGWMAYSARGEAGAPPLDSARARRDQFLYTSVDSVERHFEGTACTRP